MKEQPSVHPSFWVSLWQSDDFVSLVHRIVMMASSSAATWATVRGYLPGELAGLLALFALTVSQKFSSWNRGRATAKAAAEALGVAGLPAEVARDDRPMRGPGWSRNPNQPDGDPPDMRVSETRVGPMVMECPHANVLRIAFTDASGNNAAEHRCEDCGREVSGYTYSQSHLKKREARGKDPARESGATGEKAQ